MNYGNDDFKKMDLNFDPTQEAKINLENEPKPTAQQTPVQPTVTPTQPTPVQPVVTPEPIQPRHEEQSSFTRSESFADEDVLSAIDKKIEASAAIINESTLNQQAAQGPSPIKIEDNSQPMDKTLEFIIQNDPVKTDLTIDQKKDAKKAEKKAYKHRRISYLWIFVAILSIVFGIDSIWRFASNLSELIDDFANGSGWFFDLITVIVHSFEALLFIFFIIFATTRYKANHKPWIKWWDDTEPLRIAQEIKEQKLAYTKNIERINALSLYYIPVQKESHSDHELLSNLKAENKVLSDMISREESRRKEEAKKK